MKKHNSAEDNMGHLLLCIFELEPFIVEVMLKHSLEGWQRQMASPVQIVKAQVVRNTRKVYLIPEQEPFSFISIEGLPNSTLTLIATYVCNWQDTWSILITNMLQRTHLKATRRLDVFWKHFQTSILILPVIGPSSISGANILFSMSSK